MNRETDGIDFLEKLLNNLQNAQGMTLLGEEMQVGTRLAETTEGSETNRFIELSQQSSSKEEFKEKITDEGLDNLEDIGERVTDELLERAIEDIFGK